MRYTTLLFDLDHTLFDADASEEAAFHDTLTFAGAANPSVYYDTYNAINVALWAKVEAEKLTPNDVRYERFRQLVDATDLDADPIAMGDRYVWGFGNNGDLYPGARDLLETLASSAALAIITNGIGEVQRTRIDRLALDRYFDAVVISGEVGAAKPGTEIFDIVFEQLGQPDKATSLMIGDNLGSDIKGGINYGIDTCWFNPNGRVANGLPITHEISDLDSLHSIVGTSSGAGGVQTS